jgi:hypothetical protein
MHHGVDPASSRHPVQKVVASFNTSMTAACDGTTKLRSQWLAAIAAVSVPSSESSGTTGAQRVKCGVGVELVARHVVIADVGVV